MLQGSLSWHRTDGEHARGRSRDVCGDHHRRHRARPQRRALASDVTGHLREERKVGRGEGEVRTAAGGSHRGSKQKERSFAAAGNSFAELNLSFFISNFHGILVTSLD